MGVYGYTVNLGFKFSSSMGKTKEEVKENLTKHYHDLNHFLEEVDITSGHIVLHDDASGGATILKFEK